MIASKVIFNYVYTDQSAKAVDESLIACAISTFFFVFFASSCQPTWIKTRHLNNAWVPTESSTVCISVSNETLPSVIDAVMAWDKAIGSWRRMIPVVGINGSCTYLIRETKASPDVPDTVLASAQVKGKEAKLYVGRYEIDPLGVTLHEIGHLLGAGHIEGTLMSPYIKPGVYRCPDAASVAQVALANAVDPSLFKWCNF